MPLFLLAGDRLGRPLAGARIGVCALATNRQAAAVPQATVVAKIHQPLDVHRHLAAEVTLDHVVLVDRFADLDHFGVGQLVDATFGRNTDLGGDFLGLLRPDPMDILQRDHHALVRRDIDASNTSQLSLSFIRPPPAGLDRSTTRDRTPLPTETEETESSTFFFETVVIPY